MLVESQYHQFKEGLAKPKPKEGMAFITDFERKDPKDLLAITGQVNQEDKCQAKPKPGVVLAPPPPQKKPEEEL